MHIGDKITIKPYAWTAEGTGETVHGKKIMIQTTGRIVGFNRRHRWYRVEYQNCEGLKFYECFHYIPDSNAK